MVDPRTVANEVAARAALAAGKSAAKRALEDLMSSDEDRAAKEAERAVVAKKRRTKLIAYGVIAALLLVGLVGMVIGYWQYFLLLGLLGVAGIYGRYRLGAWRKARASAKGESSEAQVAEVVRGAGRAEPEKRRTDPEKRRAEAANDEARRKPTPDEGRTAEAQREARALEEAQREARALEEAQREARAVEEARAEKEREIDEELSAMKARLKK